MHIIWPKYVLLLTRFDIGMLNVSYLISMIPQWQLIFCFKWIKEGFSCKYTYDHYIFYIKWGLSLKGQQAISNAALRLRGGYPFISPLELNRNIYNVIPYILLISSTFGILFHGWQRSNFIKLYDWLIMYIQIVHFTEWF